MVPWLWLWAPQVHFPFSGSVAQTIEPDTSWFFGAIPARAGIAEVEQRAVQVASYGRQLGLITEVLLDAIDQQPPRSTQAKASARRLREIRDRIEALKGELLVAPAQTARLD